MSKWDQNEEILDGQGSIPHDDRHVIHSKRVCNVSYPIFHVLLILIDEKRVDGKEDPLHSQEEDHEAHQDAVILGIILAHCSLVEIVKDEDNVNIEES